MIVFFPLMFNIILTCLKEYIALSSCKNTCILTMVFRKTWQVCLNCESESKNVGIVPDLCALNNNSFML